MLVFGIIASLVTPASGRRPAAPCIPRRGFDGRVHSRHVAAIPPVLFGSSDLRIFDVAVGPCSVTLNHCSPKPRYHCSSHEHQTTIPHHRPHGRAGGDGRLSRRTAGHAVEHTPSTAGAPPTFGTGPVSGPPVSPSTFAEAEKLVQVTMTPAEREMAAASWQRSMAPQLERRVGPRKVALDSKHRPGDAMESRIDCRNTPALRTTASFAAPANQSRCRQTTRTSPTLP